MSFQTGDDQPRLYEGVPGENDAIYAGGGNDTIYGYGGGDWLYGAGDNDLIDGGTGEDWLEGGSGNDTLYGGDGADDVGGGTGSDQLWGGLGADEFNFDQITWSNDQGGIDTIRDFSQAQGDMITLMYIDADSTTSGGQAFTFVGSSGFCDFYLGRLPRRKHIAPPPTQRCTTAVRPLSAVPHPHFKEVVRAMSITTNLGDLTVNSVKQLIAAPAKKPDSAEAKETMAPLDRLRSLMAKNGGKPSYEVLSELFKLPEEDQKAAAEALGGWVETSYSHVLAADRFGLKQTVITGIHKAAAEGRKWDTFVEVGGQKYLVGTGVDPQRLEAHAEAATERVQYMMGVYMGQLKSALEGQEQWAAGLPDQVGTEAVPMAGDEGVRSTLRGLSDLGVKNLTLTRGPEGEFSASSFTFHRESMVEDWDGGRHSIVYSGRGNLGGWSLTARIRTSSVIA